MRSDGSPVSGSVAARIIPFDSTPMSFAGARFATKTNFRPTSCSAVYAVAMPPTIVRTSSPSFTVIFISFFDFSTFSAAITSPTRRSIFMKSEIEILLSDAAGDAERRGLLRRDLLRRGDDASGAVSAPVLPPAAGDGAGDAPPTAEPPAAAPA